MNIISKYVDYLKDNPEHYWFKRKLFGWGWTPVTWQGWLVILFFIIFLIKNGLNLSSEIVPTDTELFWFFTRIILAIIVLILICYRFGEKPRWQWGLPKKDK